MLNLVKNNQVLPVKKSSGRTTGKTKKKSKVSKISQGKLSKLQPLVMEDFLQSKRKENGCPQMIINCMILDL